MISQDLTCKMIDFARQLDEGLISKSEYLNAMIDALINERMQDQQQAHTRLGAWMSEALDNKSICQAMKDDIHLWMSVNYNLTPIPDLEPGEPGDNLPK